MKFSFHLLESESRLDRMVEPLRSVLRVPEERIEEMMDTVRMFKREDRMMWALSYMRIMVGMEYGKHRFWRTIKIAKVVESWIDYLNDGVFHKRNEVDADGLEYRLNYVQEIVKKWETHYEPALQSGLTKTIRETDEWQWSNRLDPRNLHAEMENVYREYRYALKQQGMRGDTGAGGDPRYPSSRR